MEFSSTDSYTFEQMYQKILTYSLWYDNIQYKHSNENISCTIISVEYPQKLVKHLKEVLEYNISEKYKGIYQIIKEKDCCQIY